MVANASALLRGRRASTMTTFKNFPSRNFRLVESSVFLRFSLSLLSFENVGYTIPASAKQLLLPVEHTRTKITFFWEEASSAISQYYSYKVTTSLRWTLNGAWEFDKQIGFKIFKLNFLQIRKSILISNKGTLSLLLISGIWQKIGIHSNDWHDSFLAQRDGIQLQNWRSFFNFKPRRAKKATFFSSLKAAKHEMILISIHHYKFACSINWTFLLCQFDFFHG